MSGYKDFLGQWSIHLKTEKGPQAGIQSCKYERKLDLKGKEMREFLGKLEIPKIIQIGTNTMKHRKRGTSSSRCMYVRCVTKGLCEGGEEKPGGRVRFVG